MKRIIALLLFAASFQVHAQTSSSSQTVLTWDATPPEVLSVGVERKAGACAATGTFAVINGNIVPPARVMVDAAVTQGATYCYRAFSNGAGAQKSAYSNTVERTVPFAIPPAPANLRVQ